jgi:hypothetical protein
MHVATEAASPGIFTKMLVVDPPYIAPYNNPASMIIDPVGSKYIVIGSKIDKVEAGPNPGKTPTSVPKVQPRKQYNRFKGVNIFVNPLIKSIPFPSLLHHRKIT